MIKFIFALLFSVNAFAGGVSNMGSSPAALQILTATSTAKTPTASNNWNDMTNNSIVLTPGTWELVAGVQNVDTGGASGISYVIISIFGSDGADSASTPTLLSATSNLTVNSAMQADGFLYGAHTGGASVRANSVAHVIVTVSASVTVYAVPLATVTTAANCRLTTVMTARRIY
jgi:hypothetical protein